ncbi:unnamed protein product [Sympodiomycopsis kandeliae]
MALYESMPSVMGRLASDSANNTAETARASRYPSLSRRVPSSQRYSTTQHTRELSEDHQHHHPASRPHDHIEKQHTRRPSFLAQTRDSSIGHSYETTYRHRPSTALSFGPYGCTHGHHVCAKPERRRNREGVGTILGIGTSYAARDYAHPRSVSRSVPGITADVATETLQADEKTLRDEPLFSDRKEAEAMDVSAKIDLLLKQNAAIWSRISTLEEKQVQLASRALVGTAAGDLPFGLSRPPSLGESTASTLKTKKAAVEKFHCGHLSDDLTYVRQRENALVLSIVATIMVILVALVWLVIPLDSHISPIFSTGSSLVWSCLSSWLSLRLLEGYRGWGEPE